MQGIFLPAMAIAFAVAPVAGQNFGAQQPERVRETFRSAAGHEHRTHARADAAVPVAPRSADRLFSKEPEVIEVGALFLRLISWNFVAQRHRVHLLEPVPGARQHGAVTAQFGDAAADLRDSCDLARFAARLSHRARLVSVGCDRWSLQTIISLLLLRIRCGLSSGGWVSPSRRDAPDAVADVVGDQHCAGCDRSTTPTGRPSAWPSVLDEARQHSSGMPDG